MLYTNMELFRNGRALREAMPFQQFPTSKGFRLATCRWSSGCQKYGQMRLTAPPHWSFRTQESYLVVSLASYIYGLPRINVQSTSVKVK
jgi:hypothetical protein